MSIRKLLLLATTALVVGAGCEIMPNKSGLVPQEEELGPFGLPVGEPIDVISATRGDGATIDFDQVSVTFNNAAGTDITITTAEGENINFTLDDPDTWVGEDPDLGLELARLTSDRGDMLEVMIGSATVPVPPEPPADDDDNGIAALNGYDTEERLAFAVARLDEADTRPGFETYAVIGEETDPDNLPRYAEDQLDGEGGVIPGQAAGDLITGTAWYSGDFVASVYSAGKLVTDQARGGTTVTINFANATVGISMDGGYYYDDIDDAQPVEVVDVTSQSGLFVQSVDPSTGSAITNIDTTSAEFLTGVSTVSLPALTGFDTTSGTFLTGVSAETAAALTGFDVSTGQFVTGVTVSTLPVDAGDIIGTVDVGGEIFDVVSVVGTNYVVGVGTVSGDAITAIVDPTTGFFVQTIDTTAGSAITGIVDPTTGEFVTAVNSTSGSALTGIVDVTTNTFVTDVGESSALALTSVGVAVQNDNGDFYGINLSGSGGPTDVSFDNGVRYTGALEGEVDVPDGTDVSTAEVAGAFGGAVYGPGDAAFDVLDQPDAEYVASQGEILNATATAGVFEANSNADPLDDNAAVEIVGTFGAEAGCGECVR